MEKPSIFFFSMWTDRKLYKSPKESVPGSSITVSLAKPLMLE
jgi:hypothetical protein